MFLIPTLVIGVAAWMLFASARQTHLPVSSNGRDPALEIARERLARGQIDAAEYARLVDTLVRGHA